MVILYFDDYVYVGCGDAFAGVNTIGDEACPAGQHGLSNGHHIVIGGHPRSALVKDGCRRK